LVGDYVEDWDIDGLFTQLEQMYPVGLATEDVDTSTLERGDLIEELRKDAVQAYEEREEELGAELMRALERFVLLQIIDDRWREHLHDMDYLREGIHLRGFAQIDPLVAYKNEGFGMFSALMNSVWEEFARYIFHVEVEVEARNGGGEPAHAWPLGGGSSSSTSGLSYAGGTAEDQPSALAAAAQGGGLVGAAGPAGDFVTYDGMSEPPLAPVVQTRRLGENDHLGRNDPCWCGSGKKFKKCHGA
nr:SEC-C domain-containing protein [Thermoleophilaceae bacterium]